MRRARATDGRCNYYSGDRWEVKTTLSGHTDRVGSCAISADGKLAVTASADFTARIWNLTTGDALHVLRHEEEVLSCTFAPFLNLVLTASSDRKARLYEAEGGTLLKALDAGARLFHASFSPDGAHLATAGQADVRLWSTSTGTLAHTIPVQGASYSVAFADGTLGISRGHTTELWDVSALTGVPAAKKHATSDTFPTSQNNNSGNSRSNTNMGTAGGVTTPGGVTAPGAEQAKKRADKLDSEVDRLKAELLSSRTDATTTRARLDAETLSRATTLSVASEVDRLKAELHSSRNDAASVRTELDAERKAHERSRLISNNSNSNVNTSKSKGEGEEVERLRTQLAQMQADSRRLHDVLDEAPTARSDGTRTPPVLRSPWTQAEELAALKADALRAREYAAAAEAARADANATRTQLNTERKALARERELRARESFVAERSRADLRAELAAAHRLSSPPHTLSAPLHISSSLHGTPLSTPLGTPQVVRRDSSEGQIWTTAVEWHTPPLYENASRVTDEEIRDDASGTDLNASNGSFVSAQSPAPQHSRAGNDGNPGNNGNGNNGKRGGMSPGRRLAKTGDKSSNRFSLFGGGRSNSNPTAGVDASGKPSANPTPLTGSRRASETKGAPYPWDVPPPGERSRVADLRAVYSANLGDESGRDVTESGRDVTAPARARTPTGVRAAIQNNLTSNVTRPYSANSSGARAELSLPPTPPPRSRAAGHFQAQAQGACSGQVSAAPVTATLVSAAPVSAAPVPGSVSASSSVGKCQFRSQAASNGASSPGKFARSPVNRAGVRSARSSAEFERVLGDFGRMGNTGRAGDGDGDGVRSSQATAKPAAASTWDGYFTRSRSPAAARGPADDSESAATATAEEISRWFKAAALGKTTELERLLRARPELISARTTDFLMQTALHVAATHARPAAVNWLLARDPALIGARTRDNETALHLAAEAGAVEVLEALLLAGSDLGARDCDRQTARDRALSRGHSRFVQELDDFSKWENSL
mmetsp:Transcript_7810/g.20084  ORF Transcript_7810/g.20084 Transcript_7810/m.20084 type:complete len:1003 (+) Transcript_7810:536-3544(+)